MQYPSDRRHSGINAGAKKLLASGESWRKQACSLTLRQGTRATVMPLLSPLLPPLVARPAEPAQTTRAISATECSVHWALLVESGLLSTSVHLHLQTTIGRREAPWWPQLPRGHSGKSGSQKQVGLFTETWSLG